MYQSNFFGEEGFKNKVFSVTIGNAKNIEMYDYHPHSPEIKYVQNEDNTFVLCSLDSGLFASY